MAEMLNTPWVPHIALPFLESIVTPQSRVWEWGSGGSTIWFAERALQVESIEHDIEWAEQVTNALYTRGLASRSNVRLVLPEPGEIGSDRADPEHYFEKGFEGYRFTTYVELINRWADEWFDLVFVDGQARPSCIVHALPKIKHGGWLFLDNAEREFYTILAGELLEDYETKWFWGPGPVNPYKWGARAWRIN